MTPVDVREAHDELCIFCGRERRENGGVPERPVREGVDPERRSTLAALASGESAPRFYDTRPFLIGRSHFFPTAYGGGLSRLRLVRLR